MTRFVFKLIFALSINVIGTYYFILLIMWLCDAKLDRILSLQPWLWFALMGSGLLTLLFSMHKND